MHNYNERYISFIDSDRNEIVFFESHTILKKEAEAKK